MQQPPRHRKSADHTLGISVGLLFLWLVSPSLAQECIPLLVNVRPLVGPVDAATRPVFTMYQEGFPDTNQVETFGVDWSFLTKPFNTERGGTIVALHEKKPIGFAVVTHLDEPDDDVFFINLIYVAPEFRSRTVGRQILKSIERLAAQWNTSAITAQSIPGFSDFDKLLRQYGFDHVEGSPLWRLDVAPLDFTSLLGMNSLQRAVYFDEEIRRDAPR